MSDARQLEDGSVVLMPMGVARKLRFMLYVPNWSAVNAIAPMRCDVPRVEKGRALALLVPARPLAALRL